MFLKNNSLGYILENYQKIYLYLTTPKLKQEFINTIIEITATVNVINGSPSYNQNTNHHPTVLTKK